MSFFSSFSLLKHEINTQHKKHIKKTPKNDHIKKVYILFFSKIDQKHTCFEVFCRVLPSTVSLVTNAFEYGGLHPKNAFMSIYIYDIYVDDCVRHLCDDTSDSFAFSTSSGTSSQTSVTSLLREFRDSWKQYMIYDVFYDLWCVIWGMMCYMCFMICYMCFMICYMCFYIILFSRAQ